MIYYELSNNNVFQLFYHILSIVKSLKELNNCCNIPEKNFTILEIIQLIEFIAIVLTLSLFNPLKTISMVFYIGLYSLEIGG